MPSFLVFILLKFLIWDDNHNTGNCTSPVATSNAVVPNVLGCLRFPPENLVLKFMRAISTVKCMYTVFYLNFAEVESRP